MDILDGRVAVITGAGSGIGRGIALELGRRGARLVLADLNADRVRRVAEEVRGATESEVLAVETDVSSEAAVVDLADRAFATFGAVHVLCNNAGVATVGYSWEQTAADWDLVLGVNLRGVVHGITAFLPRMLESGQPGHVVNTSSMAGLMTVPLKAPYTAAKHAVVGLSKALRAELSSLGAPVGVSVVCPGPVSTAIMDDEIARYDQRGPLDLASRNVLDGLKAAVDQGISAEQVGEIIVDAVRSDRFWVFPNSADYFGPMDTELAEIKRSRDMQRAG
jgi:NAD(P)-dependent dehydrogenase (short-subunit alcohol dehydrogenase family)